MLLLERGKVFPHLVIILSESKQVIPANYVVYAEITSRNPGEIVSVVVSVGISADKSNLGVIMEQALFDKKKETVKR